MSFHCSFTGLIRTPLLTESFQQLFFHWWTVQVKSKVSGSVCFLSIFFSKSWRVKLMNSYFRWFAKYCVGLTVVIPYFVYWYTAGSCWQNKYVGKSCYPIGNKRLAAFSIKIFHNLELIVGLLHVPWNVPCYMCLGLGLVVHTLCITEYFHTLLVYHRSRFSTIGLIKSQLHKRVPFFQIFIKFFPRTSQMISKRSLVLFCLSQHRDSAFWISQLLWSGFLEIAVLILQLSLPLHLSLSPLLERVLSLSLSLSLSFITRSSF